MGSGLRPDPILIRICLRFPEHTPEKAEKHLVFMQIRSTNVPTLGRYPWQQGFEEIFPEIKTGSSRK